MKNLRKLHIPIGILLLIAIFASCSTSKNTGKDITAAKRLNEGWYTYKQITKAGYQCEPFKGRHYIRHTQDSARVNIHAKTN